VPGGKAIFFPLLNGLSFPPEFPDEGDPCLELDEPVEQIRCDVNDDLAFFAPDVLLEVSVNGVRIKDPFAYRAQTGPGGFTFRSGAFGEEQFGYPPGDRFPAVADGWWILLKPLPPGVHTINFSAEFPAFQFELGANYTLTVVDDDDDDD
jgi:hypothetical protein